MNDVPTALLVAAGAIAALMLATWLASLARKDASIVDIVWGLGFVVVAWAAWSRQRTETRHAGSCSSL